MVCAENQQLTLEDERLLSRMADLAVDVSMNHFTFKACWLFLCMVIPVFMITCCTFGAQLYGMTAFLAAVDLTLAILCGLVWFHFYLVDWERYNFGLVSSVLTSSHDIQYVNRVQFVQTVRRLNDDDSLTDVALRRLLAKPINCHLV